MPEPDFIEGVRQTGSQVSLDIVQSSDRALTASSDDVCRCRVCVHFNERRRRSQPDSTDSDLDPGTDGNDS